MTPTPKQEANAVTDEHRDAARNAGYLFAKEISNHQIEECALLLAHSFPIRPAHPSPLTQEQEKEINLMRKGVRSMEAAQGCVDCINEWLNISYLISTIDAICQGGGFGITDELLDKMSCELARDLYSPDPSHGERPDFDNERERTFAILSRVARREI